MMMLLWVVWILFLGLVYKNRHWDDSFAASEKISKGVLPARQMVHFTPRAQPLIPKQLAQGNTAVPCGVQRVLFDSVVLFGDRLGIFGPPSLSAHVF